jgi:hypothetical protein
MMLAAASPAWAIEDETGLNPTTDASGKPLVQPSKKKKKKSKTSARATPVTPTPAVTPTPIAAAIATPYAAPSPAAENVTNRLKALQGSKSRFSGQLNLTYYGSSLSHPVSDAVGNPLGQTNPYPVSLQGIVAVRYRLDKATTIGLGAGVYFETPFFNPSNGSMSNPIVDLARTFKTGALHHYSDFAVNAYTDHNYHTEAGYNWGASVSDDISYGVTSNLTLAVNFAADINTFSSTPGFDLSGQDLWDINAFPYLEYKFNDMFNLRTLLGFQYQHLRSLDGISLHALSVYQSTGLGIRVVEPLFIYVFLQETPFNGKATLSNNLTGFNIIFNLL